MIVHCTAFKYLLPNNNEKSQQVPHKKVCRKFGMHYQMLLSFEHVLKHMIAHPVKKKKQRASNIISVSFQT